MATASVAGEDLRKELTCSICLDCFIDPVILKCGHNFCQDCICMHWEENGGDYSGYQCPQCRTVFKKKSFTKNYLVQNLVDKLENLDCQGSRPAPVGVLADSKCERHGREMDLFCLTDSRRVCEVCMESRAHRHHKIAPVPVVVEDMKMDLDQMLMDLNWQKAICLKVIAADEQTKSDVTLKKLTLKEKIENDVGTMVQFLLDERDALLDSLDAEEEATMARIDDNLKIAEKEAAVVDKDITAIYNSFGGDPNIETLAQTHKKVTHCKPFTIVEAVKCPSDWTNFSGPFQLIMWKKMMHVLHTIPQNLTLDPDTAHPNLAITDFDTQVEETYSHNLALPDLPGRFTRFCGVLATARFSSGQHYWEVDVKDKGVWYLGVTTEYSERKGFVRLTPSAGYWSLCLQDRLYANRDEGRIPVSDYWNSPRVGVYLDYDNGRLSFYDAITMRRLYIFNTCFMEPVYPFFSPGKNDPGSRLQICHFY